MPTLTEILARDIDRTIDGVVKADDEAHVFQEIDEYVLTQEVARQLERLAENYLESIEAAARPGSIHPVNGVWISGYFGSGKSHLLKMLAHLFENRKLDGRKVGELFLPKVDDQFLKANLQRAVKVPSQSILFNIEALVDAARKDDETSILLIFEKALNRMMGYYHENRAIAEFERHLTEEGSYDEFQEAYRRETGRSWREARAKAFDAELLLPRAAAASLFRLEPRALDAIEALCDRYEVSQEIAAWQIRNSGTSIDEDSLYALRQLVSEKQH